MTLMRVLPDARRGRTFLRCPHGPRTCARPRAERGIVTRVEIAGSLFAVACAPDAPPVSPTTALERTTGYRSESGRLVLVESGGARQAEYTP